MSDSPRVWWTLWVLYVVAWTTALLAVFPVQARNAVLREDYWFSSSKALHVTGYAVLVLLTSRLPGLTTRRLLLAFAVLHAPLTEVLQEFTGRTCSLMDVGFDLVGVTLGVLLTWRRWAR